MPKISKDTPILSDRYIAELFSGTTMEKDTPARRRGLMIDCVLKKLAGYRDSYTVTKVCSEAKLLTDSGMPSKMGVKWAVDQIVGGELTIFERVSDGN